MNKIDFKKVLGTVKFHASVMARGFARTLYGTLVTVLLFAAGYIFVVIKSEAGYSAVCDFIAALAAVVVALTNMYFMGGKKRGGKK